jgi:hypothetical protein
MRQDNILYIGDRIDLIGDRGRVYKSMIEEVIDNVLYLVAVPRHSGMPMPLNVNDEVALFFYHESGRYLTRMRVAGFEKKGDIRLALLFMITKPEQDQRRGAYRLSSNLEVQICEYKESIEKKLTGYGDVREMPVLEITNSRDLSVTGIGLQTKREYELGEKRLLKIYFSRQKSKTLPFLICGKVTRFIPFPGNEMNNVGMQFFGQTKNMNEYILKYVMGEQEKLIKKNQPVSLRTGRQVSVGS